MCEFCRLSHVSSQRTKKFLWRNSNFWNYTHCNSTFFFWTISSQNMCSEHLVIYCTWYLFSHSSVRSKNSFSTHTCIYLGELLPLNYIECNSDRASNHNMIWIGRGECFKGRAYDTARLNRTLCSSLCILGWEKKRLSSLRLLDSNNANLKLIVAIVFLSPTSYRVQESAYRFMETERRHRDLKA